MIKFKELIGPKPSDHIYNMIDGLKNPQVKVDMQSYGHINEVDPCDWFEGPVCFGCAATCAVLNKAPKYKKNYFVAYQETDLGLYEIAIDSLREGDPMWLLKYLGMTHLDKETWMKGIDAMLPYLDSDYTEEQLSLYIIAADTLAAKGY